MKKEYIKPNFEAFELCTTDIITESPLPQVIKDIDNQVDNVVDDIF